MLAFLQRDCKRSKALRSQLKAVYGEFLGLRNKEAFFELAKSSESVKRSEAGANYGVLIFTAANG